MRDGCDVGGAVVLPFSINFGVQMGTFKDSKGQDWSVEINVEAAKRMRAAGLDLADLFGQDTKLLNRLGSDDLFFADVLWSIVQPQASSLQIDQKAFNERLDGTAMESASKQVLEGITSFSRSPHRRALMQNVMAKTTQLEEVACNAAIARMNAPELIERVRAAASGGPSTRLPGSSGSTPEGSPSVS